MADNAVALHLSGSERLGNSLRDGARNSLVSEVIVDHENRILSVNDDFYKLYRIDSVSTHRFLPDLIETRRRAGWHGLAELLADSMPVATRTLELRGSPIGAAFHLSSSGEVVLALHCISADGSKLRITATRAPVRVKPQVELSDDTRALLALRDMISDGRGVLDFIPACSTRRDDILRASFAMSDRFGVVALKADEPTRDQFFQNTLLGRAKKAVRTLSRYDWERLPGYFFINEFDYDPVFVKITRLPLFLGGPFVTFFQLSSSDVIVNKGNVQATFDKLTRAEAEVIAALCEGRTIKQVSGHLGKSHVTTAIQIRSALKKTGFSSVEMLVAKVILTCGEARQQT